MTFRFHGMTHDDFRSLIDFLKNAAEWSDFAASLYAQRKRLSKKQIAAAQRMKAKKKEDHIVVIKDDLQPLRQVFEIAVQNGYAQPKYRAEGVVITRAPDHGRNPGALYIKSAHDGSYGGKVIGTTFYPASRNAAFAFFTLDRKQDESDDEWSERVENNLAWRDPETVDEYTVSQTAAQALSIIADNPLAAAVRFGENAGRCACCGRKLTNKVSVKRGVGPICADKWGLADVEWGWDKDDAKAIVKSFAERKLKKG